MNNFIEEINVGIAPILAELKKEMADVCRLFDASVTFNNETITGVAYRLNPGIPEKTKESIEKIILEVAERNYICFVRTPSK
jgi:hypothetical protein